MIVPSGPLCVVKANVLRSTRRLASAYSSTPAFYRRPSVKKLLMSLIEYEAQSLMAS